MFGLVRRSRLLLNSSVKVSDRGTQDALFLELLDSVRQSRVEKDPQIHRRPSDVIARLTEEETEITRKLFHRLSENVSPDQAASVKAHNIDPYWDPFNEVQDERDKLKLDLAEYSALASAEEAKRVRLQIRRAVSRAMEGRYDAFSANFRRQQGRQRGSFPPTPHRVMEQFWEKSSLVQEIDKLPARITFRDLDILRHFRSSNGSILPRRVTKLSQTKHRQVTKAIKIAQHLALVPKKWNAADYQSVPLIDPMQFFVDRLVARIKLSEIFDSKLKPRTSLERKISPARAKAMLEVLKTQLAPRLDYSETS
jgi:ribosomal protein S18